MIIITIEDSLSKANKLLTQRKEIKSNLNG